MALTFLSASLPVAIAHESLYNYLEVEIRAGGAARLFISVHASEFVDLSEINSVSSDNSWFDKLDAAERAQIISSANHHLLNSYEFEWDGKRHQPGELSPDAKLDSEMRPGCFTSSLLIPKDKDSITVFYKASGKRLLLVLTRPGTFPKTIDLASGDSRKISLTP